MAMAYFGKPWDAPAVEAAHPVPTPTGQHCQNCGEAVAEGDQGFLVPTYRVADDGEGTIATCEPIHRECILASVLGRGSCLDGNCDCRTGGTARSAGERPPSIRDENRATLAWVHKHGLPPAGSPAATAPAEHTGGTDT